MTLAVAIGVAAGLGAAFRYLLDRTIQHLHDTAFPWGTLVINLTGSFVLGLTTGLATHHGLSNHVAEVVGIGLCGGFTTWSTYCWESVALAESPAFGRAAAYVAGSVVLGLGAAAAGLGLALL